MTARMIPLNQLRFGHEAEPPINARRVGRGTEIPALAASIGAHGLQTPLKVQEGHDKDGVVGIFVGTGNRRLAALRLLVEQSQMTPDAPVECIEFGSAVDAREAALAEQINRVSLHPADEYVEFHDLADAGMSEASIATRFGIDPKRVKRILALGQMTTSVLDWWRAHGATSEAFATVCAFTLAPSLDDQEKLFKKLDKQGAVRAWSVKQALGADNHEAARAIKIAGLEAYKAAGGRYTQDLFGDSHVIIDPAIAEQVANDKLNSVLEGLKAEGWSWVSTGGELPYSWSYAWSKEKPADGKATADEKKQIKKLEKAVARGVDGADDDLAALQKAIADRQWTPDQLAKAGTVLEIGHHGDLKITRGVVKPSAAKKEKSVAGKAEKVQTISNAMHDRLSIQATLAVRSALLQEPRLGLVALLAGFTVHRHLHTDSPIRVYHDGFGKKYTTEKETFASVFERLSAMSDAELFAFAAGCAAEAVHIERPYAGKPPFDANATPLAAAIDADRLTAALHETFDAIDYFNGVAKPFIIQAIREAVNEDEARKADKLKKKELVEYAVKNVQGTGWLQPELRAPTYSGPGEIPKLAVSAPPLDDDYDDDDEMEDENLDEDEAA
jgi:ParB family chromosome partitioning protein